MTETFLVLVAEWGIWAVGLSAFLSCLLIPIPTALIMLAGGAFVASGDLELSSVLMAAWLGAISGDQVGFQVGRVFGSSLDRISKRRAKARKAYVRAKELVSERGEYAVFFSTWALAPLGPYVNFAAGAGGLGVLRFTLWDAAGEAIWVGFYVLMGRAFASEFVQLSGLLSNAAAFIVSLFVAVVLGFGLVLRLRRHQRG